MSPGRKLFKYHIDQNIQQQSEQKLFFQRTNRWRFNSQDYSTFLKATRPLRPFIFGLGVIMVYDWTYGFYRVDHH